MAMLDSFGREINPVLFEGNSCVKKVILNRPWKSNSFTYEMEIDGLPEGSPETIFEQISQILKKLKEYEKDSAIKLVILKGNGKAFSAGGDLMAFYKHMTEGHWNFAAHFYKRGLAFLHLLAIYKKPLVALIDGVVMGAGAGMTMQAPYRIVTEKTVFAMPEAAIGLFPDSGASYFLSRLPGYFGEYLGLTGSQLDGAEMVACGLATHFVLSKDLQMLESELEGLTFPDTAAICQLISKFVHQAKLKQDPNAYYTRLKIVNKCFSGETVEEILLALEKEAEKGEQKWIVDAINSMKSACPASLKIFLRAIREGRCESLAQSLVREYTITSHIVRRTVSNDLYEGIKAKILGKEKKPEWQPSKLELVTKELLDQYFTAVDDDEWEPLQLPPRSNTLLKSKL